VATNTVSTGERVARGVYLSCIRLLFMSVRWQLRKSKNGKTSRSGRCTTTTLRYVCFMQLPSYAVRTVAKTVQCVQR
jgi:hypothetical protein